MRPLIVGPLREPVEVGSRVWVRYDNKVFDGVLIGPGKFDYEVEVEVGSDRERLTVHLYNVQPQDREGGTA